MGGARVREGDLIRWQKIAENARTKQKQNRCLGREEVCSRLAEAEIGGEGMAGRAIIRPVLAMSVMLNLFQHPPILARAPHVRGAADTPSYQESPLPSEVLRGGC